MSLCDYCGEQEATERLGNPNLNLDEDVDWNDPKKWWNVCSDCSKIICFRKFGSPKWMLNEDLIRIMKKEVVVVIGVKEPKKK